MLYVWSLKYILAAKGKEGIAIISNKLRPKTIITIINNFTIFRGYSIYLQMLVFA